MSSTPERFVITKPRATQKNFEVMDGPDVMTPLLWMDDSVMKGAFYMECNWFHKPTQFSPDTHTHDFDEVLAFIGIDPENPQKLNGEVELWLDGEKLVLTESCLVFIPKGMSHCPMHVRRADKPIFHYSCGMGGDYKRGG